MVNGHVQKLSNKYFIWNHWYSSPSQWSLHMVTLFKKTALSSHSPPYWISIVSPYFFTLFYAHPHDGIQLERKHIPSESKNSLDFCPAQYEEGTKSVSRFFNHRNKFRSFYQEHRIRLFRFDTCFNILPILLSASTKIKRKLHFNHRAVHRMDWFVDKIRNQKIQKRNAANKIHDSRMHIINTHIFWTATSIPNKRKISIHYLVFSFSVLNWIKLPKWKMKIILNAEFGINVLLLCIKLERSETKLYYSCINLLTLWEA